MLLRGPNPIFTYFWVAVLEDGYTVVPEFDLESGKENRWFDVRDRKITKVMWYPFNQEFADKVSAVVPRICVEGYGPVLEMDVPEGLEPVIRRPTYISQYFYYLCKSCGTKIYWLQPGHERPEGVPGMVVIEQPSPLICPHCGQHNDWFCGKCHKIVQEPIVSPKDPRLMYEFNRGEARCPVCESTQPQGLLRIENLKYMSGRSHNIEYTLGYRDLDARISPFSYLRPKLGNRFAIKDKEVTKTWDDSGIQVA